MYKQVAASDQNRKSLMASPIKTVKKTIGATTFNLDQLTGLDGTAIKKALPPKRSSSSNDLVQGKSPGVPRNFSVSSFKE